MNLAEEQITQLQIVVESFQATLQVEDSKLFNSAAKNLIAVALQIAEENKTQSPPQQIIEKPFGTPDQVIVSDTLSLPNSTPYLS